MTIKIVNYGTGNISSIVSCLSKLGFSTDVITNSKELKKSDTVIFPGVGSFDVAANFLKNNGFATYNFVGNNNKVIGICLGMHLMCRESKEGNISGLGIFDCSVLDFKPKSKPHVHLGWSDVTSTDASFQGKQYFCHRFYVERCQYTVATFKRSDIVVSNIIRSDNFWGIQSHPERSGQMGLDIFKRILQQ